MREKLYYIANIRMPTERAHGIQIMEMCQAFVRAGLDVELIVTNRKTHITEDPFAYYDIKPHFTIKKLWCLDVVHLGKFGFWIQSFTFAHSVLIYLIFKKGIFYTRDELLAMNLKMLGKNVVWEVHMGHKNIFVRTVLMMRMKMVAITEALKDLYISMGASSQDIFVAPDGADIGRFDIPISKQDARHQLSLPQDKKIVLYKGSLIPWKGAGVLAESARTITTPQTLFVFIGGTENDVESFKKEYGDIENISIKGNRPRAETPIYQKAADILVIPNSAKEDISKLYTSPMKLFGYMAGGVPMVASDLPSLREVIGEQDAYFSRPDDAQNLAYTIDEVFRDYEKAEKKAQRALEKVRKYSWEKRAESIVDFIKNSSQE